METETQYFFQLTPERVLAAVESAGLLCTGRCQALNSFENRVYDVELEDHVHRVVKFYRPGRWTKNQILEEHQFLADLVEAEIPAIAPLPFLDGSTLQEVPETGIFFTVFPRVGGRAPDELTDEQLARIGRLLGRIHTIGKKRTLHHRLKLDPATYAEANLKFLLSTSVIPLELERRYTAVVEEICKITRPWFESAQYQRIHGDCHLGNLLWNPNGAFFLDFDDMLSGPPVQDIWLLLPGRDAEAIRQREVLLEGYDEMGVFDRSSLKLIEPLRALRFIHYSTWVAKRWNDPAFPAAFPQFGTHSYWSEELRDLETQLELISK